MKGREQNLTNAQFSILNSHPTHNLAMYARGLSPRIRIENWELSIGQIDDHVPDIMRGRIAPVAAVYDRRRSIEDCVVPSLERAITYFADLFCQRCAVIDRSVRS